MAIAAFFNKAFSNYVVRVVTVIGTICSVTTALYFGLRQVPAPPASLTIKVAQDRRLFGEIVKLHLPLKLDLSVFGSPTTKPVDSKTIRRANVLIVNLGPGHVELAKSFPDGIRFVMTDPDGEFLSASIDPSPNLDDALTDAIKLQISDDRKAVEFKTSFLKQPESLSISLLHTGYDDAVAVRARRIDGPDPLLQDQFFVPYLNPLVNSMFTQPEVNNVGYGMFGVLAFCIFTLSRLCFPERLWSNIRRTAMISFAAPATCLFVATLGLDLSGRLGIPINGGFILNCEWIGIIMLAALLMVISEPQLIPAIYQRLLQGVKVRKPVATANKSNIAGGG